MDDVATARSDMKAGLPQVRRLARYLVLAAAAMYMLSGVYVVESDERGVIKRFGRVIVGDVSPGIHYRIPWPVDSVQTPQVTSIKRMSVGYKILDQARSIAPQPDETQFLTGDTNILEIQLLIQYVVKDPSAFLYAVDDPPMLVRRAGEAAMTEVIGTLGVDDVLTTAKVEIEESAKRGTQAILDSYGAGIEIVAAHLQDVSPPRQVAEAFRDVASAREDRNRIMQEASGYANSVVPMTRGDADRLSAAALGYAAEKVNAAEGEAQRFRAMLAEYRKAPEATRARLYLEIMEQVLAVAKKQVIDTSSGKAELDLRFISQRTP